MKVSHIIYLSQKPGCNPFSGAEKHIVTLVEGLGSKGVDVELIVLLWNAGTQIDETLTRLGQLGIKVTVIKRAAESSFNSRLTRALGCWYRLFLLLQERRDRIIHVHLDLRAVMAAAIFAGCRSIVISIHNDERYYSKPFWRFWLRLIDRWTAAYIGITENVRNYYLAASGIAAAKVTTVYYGVPAPMPAACVRSDFGIPEDRFVVGFVGRLTPQKNLKVLIEAVAMLPDICGVIIGQGEQREELEELAGSLGAANVLFLGAVPDADRLMPLFDALCLPSEWEGLGLVLIEAMQRGVPIIGSKAGAIPEILGGGEYGILFETHDAVALRKALETARNDREMLNRLGIRAKSSVRERFSVETMLRGTMAVYRRSACNCGTGAGGGHTGEP